MTSPTVPPTTLSNSVSSDVTSGVALYCCCEIGGLGSGRLVTDGGSGGRGGGGLRDFGNGRSGSSVGEGDRPLLDPVGDNGSHRCFSSGRSSCWNGNGSKLKIHLKRLGGMGAT